MRKRGVVSRKKQKKKWTVRVEGNRSEDNIGSANSKHVIYRINAHMKNVVKIKYPEAL